MSNIDLRKLKHLFWDVDIEKLDPLEHSFFIIERVLRYGFSEDIRMILKAYDREKIINVVKTSRSLDKKTVNYWALHFGIPKEEITCMKRPSAVKSFY